MSEPMSPEHRADIRRRNEISLNLAEDPRYALNQAEVDRNDLLAEVDRLQTAVELLGSHLQGGSQALIDVLTEAAHMRAELDSIRARGLARSDQLLAARDRCSYDDRVKRRAFEQSAAELRSLIDGAVGE